MKNKIPITLTHPNLLNEWDFEKNLRNPDEFSKGSSYQAYWKCNIGHSWKSSIYHRAKGSGCPQCRASTSLNELRLFSELIYIFPNSINRYKLEKNEIDIFIPELKIGVEYDGLRWHIEKDSLDKRKNIFFEKKGITVIRVRQKGLNKLSKHDIVTERKIDAKKIIDEILKNILQIRDASEYTNRINKYLSLPKLANEEKFNELLAYHPFPFKGKSFAEKYPTIADEWNNLKNQNLTPFHFYPNSNMSVWWKCKKGHEWKTKINHRANGSGCPYCSGRVADFSNNLFVLHANLSKEWNYTKNEKEPADYLPNSGKKVWWKCTTGHEWKATIASRNSGRGCPYCSGNFVEEKDSLFYISKLINDWNYSRNSKLNPKKLSKSSNLKVWWKCSKGHEYQATIANRTKGSGCPYCSGRRVEKQNSFATKYPHLMKQWNDKKNNLDPFELSFQSHKKVWWICNKNHEWEATVKHRVNGTRCPYCANKKIIESNSLFSLKPNLMKEWDYEKNTNYNPHKISVGSSIKVWWKCKKGHSWETQIYHRSKNESGCPYCYLEKRKKSKLIEV